MKWMARTKARLLRATDRFCPSRVLPPQHPDSLHVRSPAEGTRWTCVERHRISWQYTGALWHPCDVVLERRTDEGWAPAALLAAHVDPRALGTSVVVPDLPSGPYRVLITSPELPAAACSPPLVISHP
ncbi:hypothetical protein AMK26_20255 [Streptomyces sp. CB03234]|uniref:hypothetical protein n=1 Tax=Streptomyces sp. (strain CB03234) TaxID=1703937 RepID=UPI00093FF51F|nr:hypothetical protein [Streptomyces sp. CB03234]OKK03755.1 hypothetical protein AMK26_20255 [Streptomyces sp. CB03234]